MYRTLIFIFVIFCNYAIAQEWELQTSGVSVSLRDVYFVNPLCGWCVGDSGTVLHTLDGGITWTIQILETKVHLKALFFIDTLTGWIVGKNGILFHTTDAGLNWIKQDSKTTLPLNDIFFINPKRGWAVGGMQTSDQGILGVIIGTLDGGNSWKELIDPKIGGYHGTFFLNEQEGWVVGGKRLIDNFDEDIILYTPNGGMTWKEQHTSRVGPLRKIYFLNPENGWAAGDSPLTGGVIKTNDAGLNWYAFDIQKGPILTSELFRGLAVISNYLWISSVQDIYHSKDGGQTWEKEVRESEKLISTLFFRDLTSGWAVGESGSIWKYKEKPMIVQDNEFEYYNSLDANFPNPFNSWTQIRYFLKKDAHVVLNVFDQLGRKVVVLVNQYQKCGQYTVKFDNKNLPSGIYYYQIITDKVNETKKMLLLK